MSQFASPEEPVRPSPDAGSIQTDTEQSVTEDATTEQSPERSPERGSLDDLFGPPVPSDDADSAYIVPSPLPRPPAHPRPRARTIAAIAGSSLLLGLAGGIGGAAAWQEWGPADSNGGTPVSLPQPVSTGGEAPAEGSIPAVAAAVLPSVVQIQTASESGASTGSGLIIREDGYILTNHHVVEGADSIDRVLFSDGEVRSATVVGSSPDYDLAVIKVDATGLTPLVLGDSDAMVVGEQVVAVGSPLGLDATVTSGIISAVNRPVTTGQSDGTPAYMAAIQTDAAINPGNSGGPLLNMKAEVIGINSAIAALPGATRLTGAGSVGLGFAIPSNQARRVAEELIATGKARVPAIGAQLDRTYMGKGVRIADSSQFSNGGVGIVKGSPADVAGMKEGDVIIRIDGVPVAESNTAVVIIRSHAPGDAMTFTVERDGKEIDFTVTLGVLGDLDFADGAVDDGGGGDPSQ